jgi:hypothetical protein
MLRIRIRRIRKILALLWSGSFLHQEKIVRKPWFLLFSLWLFICEEWCNHVNVPSKSNKQKKTQKKLIFCCHFWRSHSKRAGFGVWSFSQRSGSEDPDPYQNVTNPEWIHNIIISNVKILFKEPIIAFSLNIFRYRYRYKNFCNSNILPLIILAESPDLFETLTRHW